MRFLRTILPMLAVLVLAGRAEASVRLLEEGADGLVLRWEAAAGAGSDVVRVAVPPGRGVAVLGVTDAAGNPLPPAVFVRQTGWRGLVPFAVLELDPVRVPAGVHEVRLGWGGRLPPADGTPPALRPIGDVVGDAAPAAWSGRVPAEWLNPATAAAAGEQALAPRAARPPAPARPPRGEPLRSRRLMGGAAGRDRGVSLPGSASAMGFGLGRAKIVIAPDAPSQPGGPGLYRLTPSMLAAAGIDVLGVRLADLRLLTIDSSTDLLGQALVPLRRHDANADGLFGSADWIEFWGEPMTGEDRSNEFERGDFTDERGYLLDASPAQPSPDMAEDIDGTPVSPPAPDFLATARAEVNDLFINDTRVGRTGVDHFYWCSVQRLFWQSSTGTEARRTETLALPHLAASSATRGTLRVRLLHRLPDAVASPDQRSVIDLNSRSAVSDISGDGFQQVDHVATGLVAGTDLLPSNTVTIRAPGVPGAVSNLFDLDWIEADYPRTFDADGGRLVVTHDPGASVVARGLGGSVTVLDVTDPLAPRVVNNVVTGAGTATFELVGTPGTPVRYAVQETPPGEPALVPAAISFWADPGLTSPSNACDILVVGPRAWVEAVPEIAGLARWRARRQSEGLTVMEVASEDVTDEYGTGTFTPVALAGLLTDALAHWARPPRFVLLLGDTSLDYKNQTNGRVLDPSTCADSLDPCLQNETACVQHAPTRVLDVPSDTEFLGWCTSDVLLTLVAGTDWDPDVALGRLPVRSAADAGALLDKVVDYEDLAATRPAWGSRVMMVADQIADAGEQPFETYQDAARDAHVLPHYGVTQLYYQRDFGGSPAPPFTQAILDSWRDPARAGAVLSYVGHGAAYRWSSDDVLLNRGVAPCRDDVDVLAQPGVPAPFVLNSNCITGTFVYPLGPSLLEELVRAPQGGAIAAFGPTGVTELSEARDVLMSAYGDIHGRDGRGGRLGDVVLGIQETLASTAFLDPYPLLSNAFLGDPTLRLAVPFGPAAIALSAAPGDALVDLSWPAVAGASTYNLWRSDTGAGGTYEMIAQGVAGTTHRDTGDPPGPLGAVVNNQLYHYALEPMDGAGHPGRWSARMPARPCSSAVPAAASNLAVTPGNCTGSFTLRWTASPTTGLQGYRVRVYRGPVATGAPVRTVIAPGTFLSVTGLVPWQDYLFTVSPLTWCDVEGPQLGPVAARSTCPLALDPPAYIPDLRVSRQGSDLHLAWSPVTLTVRGTPATIASYRVHRSADKAFLADAATTVADAAAVAFTDAARIGAGASLEFYAVGAIDASGRSGGVGHDLPQGARGLTTVDLGTDWEVSWRPVAYDIRGEMTPVAAYEVYNSDTAIDRVRAETGGLVPVATVAAPPAVVPKVPGFTFWFIVPQDVHGNRSAD